MKAIKLDIVAKQSSKKGKKSYPLFEGIKDIVDEIIDKDAKVKALNGDLARLKDSVKESVLPVAVANVKNGNPETSVEATGTEGSILCSFSNDFRTGADLDEVRAIIGSKETDATFRQRFSLKIDGDVLVNSLSPAKVKSLVDKLVGLLGEFGVGEALSCKEDFVPVSVAKLFEVLPVSKVVALNESYPIASKVSVR